MLPARPSRYPQATERTDDFLCKLCHCGFGHLQALSSEFSNYFPMKQACSLQVKNPLSQAVFIFSLPII